MDRYKETFHTWNKVAPIYQARFMEMDLYNETYDIICEVIENKNAKILEIGCGPGNITKYLLTKRPDFKIFGIDIASNMIELARANNPTALFKIMDIREINKIPENYDAIICGFCLPYVAPKDCKKFFADANKLLTENGMLYLSFVEDNGDKSGFRVSSSGDRVYFYYHKIDEFQTSLQQNSFEVLKAFKLNYNRSETELEIHTILIAKKKASS